jgi:hypothetical protein
MVRAQLQQTLAWLRVFGRCLAVLQHTSNSIKSRHED